MPSRTAEFKSCVQSAKLRLANSRDGTSTPEHKQRLLQGKEARQGQRSEFARGAAQIAKEIQGTMGKLEKLAQLAKRKTLFDDRPVEISELTYIIKRDIANLNGQIAKLQGITRDGVRGKQVEEHNNNVLVMLQGKLASTSMGFKDVLEMRTQNMKASKTRTEQFGYTNNAATTSAPASVLRARHGSIPADSVLYQTSVGSSSSLPNQYAGGTSGGNGSGANGPRRGSGLPSENGGYGAGTGAGGDYKGKGRMSSEGNDYLALDMGGGGAGSMESGNMQLQMQQTAPDQYLGQRATAIESIESTISELGQIFSQLATMVAQQGETVQRIDADTSDIANNVSGAQRELLKYYASVSGNRALMLKVFGILVIFFLIFTLVT